MKNTHIITTILLWFAGLTLRSQSLDLNWSDPFLNDNKLDGFFSTFIGHNSNYTYVKFSKKALKASKRNGMVVVKVLDKNTMKEIASKRVVDNNNKKDFEDLEYYRSIVFEEVIYMFWQKETRDRDELYVMTFDNKMKVINKLKKVYEMRKVDERNAKQPELFVLKNERAGTNIVIGGELAAVNGQPIKMEYKLMKSDLSFLESGQLELPISKTGRSFDGFSSEYEYGDDGKLFIYSSITPTKEERRELKKEGKLFSGYYDVISAVDMSSGSLSTYTLKFDKKYIKSYKAVTDKSSLRVTGFFCDLEKDPKGNDNHGLFYVKLDDKDLNPVASKFNYFTSTQLNELFALDRNEGKDRAGMFSSKKKKQSEDESISSLYKFEEVVSTPTGELILFGSRMLNYSRTYCTTSSNGTSSCRTEYYCQKDNITAFKLSSSGDIVWAKNMDRRKTYGGWNRYDLSVIQKNNKYYVLYGSDYQLGSELKSGGRKNKSERMDKLEYAVFDGNDGSVEKKLETVNEASVKKSDKKLIDPTNIYVMNNNFYIPSERIKRKVGPTILGCLTAPLCFGYFILMSPNSLKGTTYLGKISPR